MIGEILNLNDNFDEICEKLSSIKTLPKPKGNPGGNKNKYKDVICAFDIETSTVKTGKGPQGPLLDSFMYIWQFQMDDMTIIGRTWEDFMNLLETMKLFLGENEKYMIFVHNLSYEFVFLSGIYKFDPEDVFCMDPRKILKCEMLGCFEFRCSYLHSNMSLNEYTHKWGVADAKLSGEEFNYKKVRYPWTKLTDEELHYCVNDVRGLVQAIKAEMEFDHDDLYHFPLTSTGYVRRDVKKSMKTYNWDTLHRQLPDFEVFKMLSEAFRGGNTHANRWFAGQIIDTEGFTKIMSYDRSSSYPDCICNDKFPTGRWYIEPEFNNTLDRLIYLMKVRRKAILCRVRFTNIRLKDPDWGCPYISTNKCWDIVRKMDDHLTNKFGKPIYKDTFDNGRVMAALSLCTTLTDVDLRIIMEEYDWDDIEILQMAHSTYGKLPDQLTSCVRDYYNKKTTLKGIPEMENLYNKSKAKLNAIYGMMVQNPVKSTLLFIDDPADGNPFQPDTEKSYEELLNESNGKAFLSYAWGVWVTAWARYRLEEGIRIVHHPEDGCYFLYADTDSVKFFCDNEHVLHDVQAAWDKYNSKRQTASIRSGAWATDPKGHDHYMGVYELDAIYDDFKTLGAKKYAYHQDGKMHITIAGVNKKKGAEELEKLGGLEAFCEGTIFRDAGGTEAIYNDKPHVDSYTVGNHTVRISRNVVIKDSTYEIGITGEYKRLLQYPEIYRRIFDGMELQKAFNRDIVLPY